MFIAWEFWSPIKTNDKKSNSTWLPWVPLSYLWLNWLRENEIMHFEESRFDGQINIGWIWSDVSIRATKRDWRVELIMLYADNQDCDVVFFFLLLSILYFWLFFITWDTFSPVEDRKLQFCRLKNTSCDCAAVFFDKVNELAVIQLCNSSN